MTATSRSLRDFPTSSAMLTVILATALFVGACDDSGRPSDPDAGDGCYFLTLNELDTSTVAPAGVRVVFEAGDCNGRPLEGLTIGNVTVNADGTDLMEQGAPAPYLTNDIGATMMTAVLVDLSTPIANAGDLDTVLDATTVPSRGHESATKKQRAPASG
jgi:hypothetical protein